MTQDGEDIESKARLSNAMASELGSKSAQTVKGDDKIEQKLQ